MIMVTVGSITLIPLNLSLETLSNGILNMLFTQNFKNGVFVATVVCFVNFASREIVTVGCQLFQL